MKSAVSSDRPTGTQSIERGVMLLRCIALRGQAGCALTELARRSGIDKGTAHRILSGLVREGLVERDPVTRTYRLGSLLFELSLGRPDMHAFQRACEKPLEQLAQQLRCRTWIYLRSGKDVVIAAQSRPRSSVQAFLGLIGTRRPMLQTAGGAAMLIGMSKEEAQAIIDDNVRELSELGGPARADAAQRILKRSKALGFGWSEGHIAPHTIAAAVALRDRKGRVFAALNAGGPEELFPPSRMTEVETALRQASELLEAAAAKYLDAGVS